MHEGYEIKIKEHWAHQRMASGICHWHLILKSCEERWGITWRGTKPGKGLNIKVNGRETKSSSISLNG